MRKKILDGQLGLRHRRNIFEKPSLIMNDLSIKSVCCSYEYTMILKEEGEIVVFGDNAHGKLGNKTFGNFSIMPQTLYEKNSSILFLQGELFYNEWSIENHKHYENLFKKIVFNLLLALNYFKKNNSTKIPKFLIYQIIKYL